MESSSSSTTPAPAPDALSAFADEGKQAVRVYSLFAAATHDLCVLYHTQAVVSG